MRALSLLLTLAAAPLALAGPQLSPPDANGFVWATIGAPGNPHAPQVGGFWNPDPPRGAVDYAYRMSQTELTVGQWFEFVSAYGEYAEFPNSPSFMGAHIGSNFDGTYFIFGNDEIVQHWPASMAPRYAARFVNWLHNDKVNEQWAFESGVYDTSTFGQVEVNGLTVYTDDYTRSPNAKYWIPSLDEWVKAMHYDPNRFGEGKGGYWSYANSSDALPIWGLPEDGGESNAGTPNGVSPFIIATGSYPHTQSPWGLLDGTGGRMEMVATQPLNGQTQGMVPGTVGTSWLTDEFLHEFYAHYEAFGLNPPTSTFMTLRLASPVPGPAVPSFCALGILGIMTRRKER